MSRLTVAFDLDGTLVDTAPDLIATLNLVFAEIGVPQVSYHEARPMIGAGVRPLIERGLGAKGLSVAAEDIDPIYARFLAHYAEHIADASRPFPGAVEALDRLAGQGAILAVCTNKLEWLSVRLLSELGLAGRFAAICGQDTFGVAKPDPLVLRRTVETAGGAIGRTLMIGDSETDVALARAAGVPVIAVDFGYTSVPVASFKPDRVIGHFGELVAAVGDLMPAAA